MAYCQKCGAEIPSGSQYCPKCGCLINGGSGNNLSTEGASVGLKIISFLFPIIGWVLYFVYKDNQPAQASDCAKFGWIGFGVQFVLGFISGLAG